jgi:exonuclease III
VKYYVINVHAPSEDKSDDSKDSFYEQLKQVFNNFPKYRKKILLGDFNVKVGRDGNSNRQLEIKSLNQDGNDHGVRK